MECSNTRNVVLMHPILTPGAVTNERPGKWSCDEIKLRVHQGSKWSAPTQILFCWCTQFWPQVLVPMRGLGSNHVTGVGQLEASKKIAWEGDRHTRSRTSRLYDRIGSVGRFDEKSHGMGTDIRTDFATTRSNRPSGPIRWKTLKNIPVNHVL